MNGRASICGFFAAAAATLYLLYPVMAQQPGGTRQPAAVQGGAVSDQTFVMKAAMGGMEEVSLGKLAMQHAASPDVKRFGKRMVDDHTKANEQLFAIADKKGIRLPQRVSAKADQEITKLASFEGQAFDQKYMKNMVEDHKKDIAEFENEAKNGQDPDVKAFAEKSLPILREHLKMAEEINAKVNGTGNR
jgi:putative membrane protein